MRKPLVLMILDGFGERAERDDNAVRMAKMMEPFRLFAIPSAYSRLEAETRPAES